MNPEREKAGVRYSTEQRHLVQLLLLAALLFVVALYQATRK